MQKSAGIVVISLLLLLVAPGAAPAVANDSSTPKWVELDLEYRVRTLYANPMELSGTTVRDVNYTIQRLRVEGGFKIPDIARIVTQVDLLSGVLFGDAAASSVDF